ncbi:MAG: energy transducer TonB, partial [Pyrinomonadaceae bacterium]|nr:energy transducer TonB [Pyrinomonadaceae bacterium]
MRINSNVFIAGLLSLFLCVAVSAQESATTSQVVNGLINGKPVSGGIVSGKARNLVIPKYPVEAKAQNLSGAVKVSIVIDLEGSVIEAKAVSGEPIFHDVAIAAARQSRFSPTLLSGEPVYVTGIIVYNFVADDPEKERETKNVEDKTKVFRLSVLLQNIRESDEPLNEWREKLLRSELEEIV